MHKDPRRVIAAGIIMTLIVGLLGSAVAVAQGDGVTPAAVSNVNADRVDGIHANKYTTRPNKRAKKLVAANANGFLPNNIIKMALNSNLLDGLDSAAFATLALLGSTAGVVNEADNPVQWNQLQGVPTGIADGVDNGITSMTYSQVTGAAVPIAGNGNAEAIVDCPAGRIPVSGGHTASSYSIYSVSSFRTGNGWIIAAHNDSAAAGTITPIVHCVAAEPATSISSFSIAKKKAVKATNAKKPPRPK
jgi:hypothetical protein